MVTCSKAEYSVKAFYATNHHGTPITSTTVTMVKNDAGDTINTPVQSGLDGYRVHEQLSWHRIHAEDRVR